VAVGLALGFGFGDTLVFGDAEALGPGVGDGDFFVAASTTGAQQAKATVQAVIKRRLFFIVGGCGDSFLVTQRGRGNFTFAGLPGGQVEPGLPHASHGEAATEADAALLLRFALEERFAWQGLRSFFSADGVIRSRIHRDPGVFALRV
jgi:hypothetical protein